MKLSVFPLMGLLVSLAIPAWAAERHMMQQLVPDDKLAAARALTSPLPNSPEIVAQGKRSTTARAPASTAMEKTEMAMGRWRLN